MLIRCGGFILLGALLLGGIARPGTAQSTTAPRLNPSNGHYYQAVRVAGAISWDDARAAAQSLTYAGFPGHLVTFTSATEHDFVARNVFSTVAPTDQLWLGGYQDGSAADYLEPRGGWRWVTGEPWSYTAWEAGEPNNYGGNEDALDYHHGAQWNDFPRSSGLNGYIVEFEPLPIATGPLLSITPNPVVGGQPATGQVILAQPAGPGGVVLTLSSSNPAAAVVPASVTVPTGANSFSFPVTTFPVASPADATITVHSPAGDASAPLEVLPASAPAPQSPVYNPANGHWYQAVPVPGGVAWPTARADAAAQSYAGYPGHLATITSAAETQFLVSQLPLALDDHWRVGGFQDHTAPDYSEPTGGWRWITGESSSYTNWRSGEPNNVGGEDFLEIHTDGTWNDTADQPPGGGYIVEYEPAALPVPPTAAQIVLFPNPVPGGLLALGQVTLAQPAGTSGATLNLTSSNPTAALVPAAVPILPGATTVTFPILTFPVTVVTPVQITAGGSAGPATATLQVLPLVASPPPPSTAANLLVNGSFEQPASDRDQGGLSGSSLPGWRITRGSIDLLVASFWQTAPGSGRQCLDLAGLSPGTIEQSFPTEPGREYVFSGWMAHNPDNPAMVEGRGNVSLNGQFFIQLYHRDPRSTRADMRWVPFAYRFRATAPTSTLAIEDVTNIWPVGGLFLDGLAVTPADAPLPPSVPPPASGPPAAPTGLSVTRVSAHQLTLAWIDNSNNERAFAIWRKGGADWTRVGVVAPNKTAFADTGLQPGTTYTYRVRATNQYASDWSNEVTVTTPAR